MYSLTLTESYCPAQTDQPLLDLTVGDVLREAAARTPGAPALHEADADGSLRRHWTTPNCWPTANASPMLC